MSENQENNEEGDVVMPFYVVCDVSGSMSGDIGTLTGSLAELKQLIADEPVVADVVQICIITFSSSGQVVVPLGHLDEASIPPLSAGGSTSYGSAFRTLRTAIDSDASNLRAQHKRVYRPCAFFLTDGQPTDTDWLTSFKDQFHWDAQARTGNVRYPRFIPFGFRDAQLDTLSKIAYPSKGGQAFVQRSTDIAAAFKAIVPFMLQTILTTSGTLGSASGVAPQHITPAQVPGFVSAPSTYEETWLP